MHNSKVLSLTEAYRTFDKELFATLIGEIKDKSNLYTLASLIEETEAAKYLNKQLKTQCDAAAQELSQTRDQLSSILEKILGNPVQIRKTERNYQEPLDGMLIDNQKGKVIFSADFSDPGTKVILE